LSPRRVPTRGCTLVELLVVIGIIALLITILLPSLRNARESAIRVKCMSNIRQLTSLSILYATQNRGALPPFHNRPAMANDPTDTFVNATPYWFSQTFRDYMMRRYNLTRSLVYCPANPDWNRDELWNFPNSNPPYTANGSVWGYVYVGGNPDLARNPNWSGGPGTRFDHANFEPNTRLYYAVKTSDKPAPKVIWFDLTRSNASSAGGYFRSGYGSNHITAQEASPGIMPPGTGGTNVGFADGHVEWRAQKEMKVRIFDSGNIASAGVKVYW
jgi:prepilin-type processing-associated H-X9-DG protein